MHLAGATTVMYPLWGCFEQGGLGPLAALIFLVRFYTELPVFSRVRTIYMLIFVFKGGGLRGMVSWGHISVWLMCVLLLSSPVPRPDLAL